MGNVSIRKLWSRSESDVVRMEFDGAVDLESAATRVSKISEALTVNEGLACFVLGDGGMPAGTYDTLAKMRGIKVLSKSSHMPAALFFLRGLVASECGLVKVEDANALPQVFRTLSEQSLAMLIVIPTENEQVLTDRVKNKVRDFGFDYGMRMLESHLVYLVDSDNHESRTGAVEYFSCGVSCRSDLAEIFSSYKNA